jgi:imidazolonepropionase-like amidohydrolase
VPSASRRAPRRIPGPRGDTRLPNQPVRRRQVLKAAAASAAAGLAATASATGSGPSASASDGLPPREILLTASRAFDGRRVRNETAILVRGGTIAAVGAPGSVSAHGARRIDLGDATILPGFIDLHVHVAARQIPFDRVLTHGVTTVRDLGGTLPSVEGGPGRLRYLAAGKLITVPGGYPIPVFGTAGATAVSGPAEARQAVRNLVAQGARVIKIALDPGGEVGAPWSQVPATPPPPWPMLSLAEVQAVVDEAHRLDRIVTVHLGDEQGARIALEAGVDEWAHIPANPVPPQLLQQAARRGVPLVSTLDTESHCTGQLANAKEFIAAGGTVLYGTDMGHLEIPNGPDAEELQQMMIAGLSVEDALAAATSRAAAHLGLGPLGTLSAGAPADIIAARGDVAENLKNLEYPSLVIAGGFIVREEFCTLS